MILYITRFGLYAVRHTDQYKHIAPIEVVEVVPESGEDKWKPIVSFYPSEMERAVVKADQLEANVV